MPLFNVEVSVTCTMVVQAEDAEYAASVARDVWRDGISDPDATLTVTVTGDVRSEAQLRDGWDGMCLPYGGDDSTRIKDLLAEERKMYPLTEKSVFVKKPHVCEWCAETIDAKSKANYRSYINDDDELMHGWMHPECWSALGELDAVELQDFSWTPGDFARGSLDYA